MPASDTLAETMLRQPRIIPARPGRRIVAAIAILATALGVMAGTAVPARADSDLAKALAAIAVVGIIAHAARAKDRPPAPAPKKKPKPVAATRQVPAVCGIELSGSQTRATLYSENCMVQRGVSTLPTFCAKPARIYGQRDFIYTADCLRQGGLSVPRN